MTTNPSNPSFSASDTPDRDVLISRVVEGRAQGSDWLSLQRLSGTDASVWADLAASQDQATLLSRGLGEALACADHSALPQLGLQLVGHEPHQHAGAPRSLRRLRTALPWALAATLALAFGSQFWSRPRVGPTTDSQARLFNLPTGPSAPSTAEEALKSYLDLGRQQGTVVGELPQRYVVESRPATNGEGYEVLFVRQVLERATVKDLYRTGTDESGRTVLLPASVPTPVDTPPL